MVIALGLLIILGTVINVAFAWFGTVIRDYFNGSNLLSVLEHICSAGAYRPGKRLHK